MCRVAQTDFGWVRALVCGGLSLASATSVCVAPGCSAAVVRSRSRLAAGRLRYASAMVTFSRPLFKPHYRVTRSGAALRGTSNLSVERTAFGIRSLPR